MCVCGVVCRLWTRIHPTFAATWRMCSGWTRSVRTWAWHKRERLPISATFVSSFCQHRGGHLANTCREATAEYQNTLPEHTRHTRAYNITNTTLVPQHSTPQQPMASATYTTCFCGWPCAWLTAASVLFFLWLKWKTSCAWCRRVRCCLMRACSVLGEA